MNQPNLRPIAAALILAALTPATAQANTNSGLDTGSASAPRSIAISGTANKPARGNGNGSIAVGEDSLATGVSSVAIGSSTPTLADGVIVTSPTLVGPSAGGYASIALGAGSVVAGDGFLAMALGPAATASNSNSLAVGSYSSATAQRATAVGSYSLASGNNSFAGGAGARATGLNSVAIGGADQIVLPGQPQAASASGQHSVALGVGSSASASDAISAGRGALAASSSSIAIGQGAIANGGIANGMIAIGSMAEATQGGALALGQQARATAAGSVAIGQFSLATQHMTVSFGSAGSERRLVNVADPVSGTDVVNLRYLNARLASLPPAPSGPAWDMYALHYNPQPPGPVTDPTATLWHPDDWTGQEVKIQNLAEGKRTAATMGAGVYQGRMAVAATISRRVNPERSNSIVSAGFGLAHGGYFGARAGASWSW